MLVSGTVKAFVSGPGEKFVTPGFKTVGVGEFVGVGDVPFNACRDGSAR